MKESRRPKEGAHTERQGRLQEGPMADLNAPTGGKVQPLRSSVTPRDKPEAPREIGTPPKVGPK